MAAECFAAHTMMLSVVRLPFGVAAVAETADEWRVLGTPAVPDPGPEVAHSIAASRTWVDDRTYSPPVLVASYLAVELALRPLF